MMRCCCGNVLDEKKTGRIRISPCRCEAPGPQRRTLPGPRSLPEGPFGVSREQYAQRTRLGLPPITEIERSFAKEME